MIKNEFTLIQAPIHQGQKKLGVSLGPVFMQQSLLSQNFQFKNLVVNEEQSSQKINMKPYQSLCEIVARESLSEKPLFIVGGDHSLSLGSIQGLLQVNPNLKVIWVDAHGDINTRQTSVTGAFHGMPLAFLLGYDQMPEQTWLSTFLKPENLIYFGIRDLDPAEKHFLNLNNICHYSMGDIQELGLSQVIEQIKQLVSGAQVHFSIDSDAFDPTIAPSTGVRVANGLSFESVQLLIQNVLKVASVKSCDYVELNPQISDQASDVEKTAQIGIDLFNVILQLDKEKEHEHGFNDRKCHSAKPNHIHSNF